MKKFLLWLLTLIITLPALARDFQYTYNGQTLTYTVIDEEAKTCKTKDGSYSIAGNAVSGTLEIPASVSDGTNNYSVTSIGFGAFLYSSGLTSVTIPKSVTSIDNYAFYACVDLKSITIPNSVTSIGERAFSDCYGLTSVTIPNSVTSIGEFTFYRCDGLTSVTIPNSVTSIGNSAFSCCRGLTVINVDSGNQHYASVDGVLFNKTQEQLILYPAKATRTTYTIPNTVTLIGDYAFSDCSGLTSVTIPNSVTSIGNSAFASCSGFTSVTIPNSVTSIGNNAFASCSGLTSVTIPNSVTSIGNNAFVGCYSLMSITIPNSVTSIGNNAFKGCSGLTSITIPKSVTSIGEGSFSSCRGLTFVTIPNSVTSIGKDAFSYCYGLTFVTIPNSVTSIGGRAFYNCYSLTSVTIPNSVTSIGDRAFDSCSGLKSVTIPNSVTSIGEFAFAYCRNITEIYCSAVEPPVCQSNTFDQDPSKCEVYVPKNSAAAYRAANYWKRFTHIYSYYVPGGENESLYIQGFFIEPGEVAYMPVRVRTERDYSDFTTDVYLPDGLEAVTAEDGKVDVQFAREDGSHTLSVSTQPDGAVRVAVASVDKAPMTSNGSDVLFYIRVKANNDLATGPVPVWMRNTSFKDANYEYLFNDANPHINADGVMGGADVEVDATAPAVYYNLQGVRVAQPERGQVYICVQGGKARKLVF